MELDWEETHGYVLEKLEKSSVIGQIFKEKSDGYELSEDEVNKLIGLSSVFSLSNDPEKISLSYEIITRLLEVVESEMNFVAKAEVILSRIGNFPGRDLVRSRHGKSESIPTILELECITREVENTVSLRGTEKTLTNFQYGFFEDLGSERSLSISAPTSAGKSYVLSLDLIRTVLEKKGSSIVYVVPTRALISEISNRIRQTLRDEELDNIPVRTAPFLIKKSEIDQAVVYVLTQELLMSFMNAEGEPYITYLVVDEAHEIQKGKRGIVLQASIDIALSKYQDCKLLFASPLIKNPGYFLGLFGRVDSGKYFTETISPVSQNIILLSSVYRKPRKVDIKLYARKRSLDIGEFEAGFRFNDSKINRKSGLSLLLSSNGDSVIAFSNGPTDAEKVAKKISLEKESSNDFEEVDMFIDFIKKEVHSEYPLISCLKKGIVFHYGSMPSLVRSGVEDLFKDQKLSVICCTSTLLQGVNLPAKHIVIDNPQSGKSTPMKRSDFLNLAGRAGRLLKEFHGNIWCLQPMDWDEKCYKGENLQEIKSALSNVMEDGGVILQNLLSKDEVDNKDKDLAEAALGKLFHDSILQGDFSGLDVYKNDENKDSIDRTALELEKINVNIPEEIIQNHQSIRPDHMQRLLDRFVSNQIILKDFVPMNPYEKNSRKKMKTIFNIISLDFDWDLTESRLGWMTNVAHSWMCGDPMSSILKGRVDYLRSTGSTDSVSTIIRNCLSLLESSIRFRLVKYYSAYSDLLKYAFYLTREDVTEDLIKIEPYHIYLEFGSCNKHSLNLMALGISRFTALHLTKYFDYPDQVEAEIYLSELRKININNLDMPAICKREVKNLVGVK